MVFLVQSTNLQYGSSIRSG